MFAILIHLTKDKTNFIDRITLFYLFIFLNNFIKFYPKTAVLKNMNPIAKDFSIKLCADMSP